MQNKLIISAAFIVLSMNYGFSETNNGGWGRDFEKDNNYNGKNEGSEKANNDEMQDLRELGSILEEGVRAELKRMGNTNQNGSVNSKENEASKNFGNGNWKRKVDGIWERSRADSLRSTYGKLPIEGSDYQKLEKLRDLVFSNSSLDAIVGYFYYLGLGLNALKIGCYSDTFKYSSKAVNLVSNNETAYIFVLYTLGLTQKNATKQEGILKLSDDLIKMLEEFFGIVSNKMNPFKMNKENKNNNKKKTNVISSTGRNERTRSGEVSTRENGDRHATSNNTVTY